MEVSSHEPPNLLAPVTLIPMDTCSNTFIFCIRKKSHLSLADHPASICHTTALQMASLEIAEMHIVHQYSHKTMTLSLSIAVTSLEESCQGINL
jgi:hypothetical protein